MNHEEIPVAYGGCRCMCHRFPGVKHCVPCCYPEKIDEDLVIRVPERTTSWDTEMLRTPKAEKKS